VAGYYKIQCSDGGLIAISMERITKLLEMMPILRSILFGHPQMKTKKLTTDKDGVEIVNIPHEFQVTVEDFALLIRCALEYQPIPVRTVQESSQHATLVDTIAKLGGCEKLERHLYDKDTVVNPTTPEEDFHEQFMWKYVQLSVFNNATYDEAETLALNGWSFTKSIKLNSQQLCLYYRKRRG
jgi:hypothetical protein